MQGVDGRNSRNGEHKAVRLPWWPRTAEPDDLRIGRHRRVLNTIDG